MQSIKNKAKDLATMFDIRLRKLLETIVLEKKILLGILLSFSLVYIILFSNHFYQFLHILNTSQKEILELKDTKVLGITFLLHILFGLALLCRSYQIEIKTIKNNYKIDDSINKFQKRRNEFVNELLKQLCDSGEINEYFNKKDFLKNTNFNDKEFNVYKWASSYNFCTPQDAKDMHKINAEQCIKAYEQNKQFELSKMNSDSESKLFKLTVAMASLALIQVFLGFLQLFNK